MAWTNVGFDGTINEAQWSNMAGLLGNDYVAAANGDCVVTAVAGARSVSVAAGSLYGDGVVSTNSAPEVVAMTTPVNGQWYVIALRRTWASNTSALVAIAGATTSTATPTAPPTSFPTLNTDQAVLTDQPIAWAWCNSANTNVVIYDIRKLAVKSFPAIVGSAAERDAKFMTPVQGTQVWRNDLGIVETYFGAYDVSLNPGGMTSAGWTSDTRQVGLVPIKPSTVTIATGTGAANALGVVSFTGATSVSLDGIFTSQYRNYKIVLNITTVSANANILMRFIVGGTPYTGAQHFQGGIVSRVNATQSYPSISGLTNFSPTFSNAGNPVHMEMTIYNPNVAAPTGFTAQSIGVESGQYAMIAQSGSLGTTGQATGIHFYPGAGNNGGTIQVFGIND